MKNVTMSVSKQLLCIMDDVDSGFFKINCRAPVYNGNVIKHILQPNKLSIANGITMSDDVKIIMVGNDMYLGVNINNTNNETQFALDLLKINGERRGDKNFVYEYRWEIVENNN